MDKALSFPATKTTEFISSLHTKQHKATKTQKASWDIEFGCVFVNVEDNLLHMLKLDTICTKPQQEVRDTLVMAEPQPPTQHALLKLLCSYIVSQCWEQGISSNLKLLIDGSLLFSHDPSVLCLSWGTVWKDTFVVLLHFISLKLQAFSVRSLNLNCLFSSSDLIGTSTCLLS